MDPPLSLVRIGLNRHFPDDLYTSVRDSQSVSFAPFAAMPLADSRGHVDGALYAGGRTAHCQTFNGTERCTRVVGGQAWSAYGQEDPSVVEWHGTLLTGKRDATGTLFRRARYYDPQTGRFTQEDPIGLAGGLNLYGYAGGDPVNLSDPSGLCHICIGGGIGALAGAAIGVGIYYATTDPSQRNLMGYLGSAGRGAAVGAVVGATVGLGYSLATPAVLVRLGPLGSRTVAATGAAASTAKLAAPRGEKLAQMIGRWGGRGGREGFMEHAEALAAAARSTGHVVTGQVGAIENATIYRVGQSYMVVDATNVIRSYVHLADRTTGIVAVYKALGGL